VAKRIEIIGAIESIEIIASGSGIRQLAELIEKFGEGRWRKLKGVVSRSSVTSTDMETTSRFAICIEADPEDDVELQKVYPILDDEDAEKDGMLRVIDESGEDYLYETARFLVLRLPATEAHTLLRSIEVATSTHR